MAEYTNVEAVPHASTTMMSTATSQNGHDVLPDVKVTQIPSNVDIPADSNQSHSHSACTNGPVNTPFDREILHITEFKEPQDPIQTAERNWDTGVSQGAIKVTLNASKSGIESFKFPIDQSVINSAFSDLVSPQYVSVYDFLMAQSLVDASMIRSVSPESSVIAVPSSDMDASPKEIDLQKLHNAILAIGGASAATQSLWDTLSEQFGVDVSSVYHKYLAPYERSQLKRRIPQEELASISNGTKRTLRAKSSKGVVLESPLSITLQENSISKKSQYNIYMKYLLQNQASLDDEFSGQIITSLDQLREEHNKLHQNTEADLDEVEKQYWAYKVHKRVPFTEINGKVGGSLTKIDNTLSPSSSIEHSLHPWNLHNIQSLPNSVFAALGDNDVNSNSFITPTITVGLKFATQDWKCQDHFAQTISHQIQGHRKWYFVPASEFDRFSKLLQEQSSSTASDAENRLHLNNKVLQEFISYRKGRLSALKTAVVSPQVLDTFGIKYTTTIQGPGEYILQYPQTYSFSIALDFNVAEQTPFASKSWVSYAMKGERWLSDHGIMPVFSSFRLLMKLIQNFELNSTQQAPKLSCNNHTISAVADTYNEICEDEIRVRDEVRTLEFVNEKKVEDKASEPVGLNDDDFSNAFPTRVLITDQETKESVSVSPQTLLSLSQGADEYSQNFIQWAGSGKIRIEMQCFYSDDKLAQFGRLSNNYNEDYESWISQYEELMNEYDAIPLKNFKALLLEGEKIYSNIYAFKTYDKFMGKDDAKSSKVFQSHLQSLKQYIEFGNEFVEKCQAITSIKHQQRIRNSTEEVSNLIEPDEILPKLANLIDQISTLNFTCLEIDQLVEFMNEIENFERATRLLISKESPHIREFDELINLGKSFGINLGSLKFLVRIRDKLKWLNVYEVIVSGGDPYQDKKQIFAIHDLAEFYEAGVNLLSEEDLEKLKIIEKIMNNSLSVLDRINKVLQQEEVNQGTVETVERLLDEIDEKFKLENDDRIFVDVKKYDELMDFKTSLETVSKLYEMKKAIEQEHKRFPIEEVYKLTKELDASQVPISPQDLAAIQDPMTKTMKFVDDCLHLVSKIKLISNVDYQFRPEELKSAFSKDLLKGLKRLVGKCSLSFSVQEDTFAKSSTYQFRNESNETEDEDADVETPSHNQIYCLCREYEYGSMVECDKCKEWYHDTCIKVVVPRKPAKKEGKSRTNPKIKKKKVNKDIEDLGDDDVFTCPLCELVASSKHSDPFLSGQVTQLTLFQVVKDCTKLTVFPPEESAQLLELNDHALRASRNLYRSIYAIKKSGAPLEDRIDRLYFVLRKIYGAGILLEDVLYEALSSIRRYEAMLEMQKKAKAAAVKSTPKTPSKKSPAIGVFNTPVATKAPESKEVLTPPSNDHTISPPGSKEVSATEPGNNTGTSFDDDMVLSMILDTEKLSNMQSPVKTVEKSADPVSASTVQQALVTETEENIPDDVSEASTIVEEAPEHSETALANRPEQESKKEFESLPTQLPELLNDEKAGAEAKKETTPDEKQSPHVEQQAVPVEQPPSLPEPLHQSSEEVVNNKETEPGDEKELRDTEAHPTAKVAPPVSQDSALLPIPFEQSPAKVETTYLVSSPLVKQSTESHEENASQTGDNQDVQKPFGTETEKPATPDVSVEKTSTLQSFNESNEL